MDSREEGLERLVTRFKTFIEDMIIQNFERWLIEHFADADEMVKNIIFYHDYVRQYYPIGKVRKP